MRPRVLERVLIRLDTHFEAIPTYQRSSDSGPTLDRERFELVKVGHIGQAIVHHNQ